MNFKKTALDFSHQRLTEFPKEVFETKRIYKLNLSYNKIKDIPKEIGQLKYLETLDLSNNNIRHLKAKLFELSNLKILILNKNEIIGMPKQIEKLQCLKILHLANNKLDSLPEEISNLKNLEEINLTGNCLDRIPQTFDKLSNIKTLWLAQNPLKFLNAKDFVESLPNLKSLYLYSSKLENKISSFDEAIVKASAFKGNCIPFLHELAHEREKIINSRNNSTQENQKIKVLMKKGPAKIFISYSHSDSEFLDLVKEHLKVLSYDDNLEVWDDTKIRSSDKWKEEIEKALNEATSAILLVSTKFLASDFIRNNELPSLLEAAGEKGTRIHPIIVRPCRFLQTRSLAKFQAVNNPNEPLIECSPAQQDRIMLKLCGDIQSYLTN